MDDRASAAIRPGDVPSDVLAGFVDLTPDFAIFALDPDGAIASWNRGARRIQGYDEREVVGKHVSMLYPPSDARALLPRYVLRRADEEGRFEIEGWRVRKDGTMFWADAVVTSIRGPDGTLRGFVEAERDLTTRRHAEDALREAEQRYRLLVQNVKDYAILVLDPTGHVMSWNEGAQRLTGYLADEVLGRHFGLFFTPHDRDRHHPEEELETARREGHYEEEAWRVRKDGALFWANVVVTPLLDDAHRLLGFAKVTRDLTERKRAEADLQRRAESFAALNRELDAFSHTVAHDLRAPIRAVEHLSSVLLEEEAERLSAEGRESLGALHASALRMARLVDDLLELSLANAREPRRARVDVTRMASDVAKEISSSEAKRDVDVRVEPGLEAEADPQLLRVAFTNLLSNAIKYTRDVPHAVIEVGRAATPRGSAFFVRDNGVGFDPERAQRLFEPFTRLDTASRYEGTGIGLATVRRIVRRHLGDVWAEAAPGKGATFFFTLAQPAGPSP